MLQDPHQATTLPRRYDKSTEEKRKMINSELRLSAACVTLLLCAPLAAQDKFALVDSDGQTGRAQAIEEVK